MTTVLVPSVDSRGHKALALVNSGALEQPVYLDCSRTQRLVPSCTTEGAFYVTSLTSCSCPDSKYRRARICKHRIALKLQRVLDEAGRENQQQLEAAA
jgi:SWIM zinc finger